MEYVAVISKQFKGGVSLTVTSIINQDDEIQFKEIFQYKSVKEEIDDTLLEMCGIDTETYHLLMDNLLDEVTEALEYLEYQHTQGYNFVQLLSDIRLYQVKFENNLVELGLPKDYFIMQIHKILN